MSSAMYPAAFSINSRLWETSAILFLVIPLTLLWIGSLVDTVLRKDLAIHQKIPWFAVVFLFPLVGTMLYVLRRPGWTERATSLRNERPLLESQQQAVETLENLAITLDLTRLTLKESTKLLNQITALLSDAGSTVGFALPLTRIRPLGPVENRVKRMTAQVRTLGFTMERMSVALGTNAGDLRSLARRLNRQREAIADGRVVSVPDSVDEQPPIVAQSPRYDGVRIPVRSSNATDSHAYASVEPDADGE
jgi:hypothetical protein